MDLDIAVIGGGVSGTYSAWRLQEALGNSESIALFEYSDRIGGRLYTVTMPGLPHVKAEVGGMRYIKGQQPVVTALVEHLKLPTTPFLMGAPSPDGNNEPGGDKNNLYYLRGKHLRLHELTDPEKLPYHLAWSERGMDPTQLQKRVMKNIHPDFDKLSLCEQMKVEAFNQPLYKFGFWNLLYRVLSNEGYRFMKDAGGYEANVANSCAVTQLPATEYGDDRTPFVTLREGFQELPLTLAKRFEEAPGKLPAAQRLQMNRRLARIEICEGAYKLHFEPTAGASETLVVHAKKVILAMPRRSLELIEGSFFEDPWLKENLPSVLNQSAFKLFLAYERPWWRALGLVAGRSVTDLPIRQVYYFGTERDQDEGEPWLNSLLMAAYNDIGTLPFWKGLQQGDLYVGDKPSYGGEPGPGVPIELMPTDQMVRSAHNQVEELHGLPEISPPYAAVYHSWDDDPYGGGWHEWKAGVRLDQIICKMRKPVAKEAIFIVGEAYSFDQGWVEGALTTAESTLEDFFELDPPGWLKLGNDTLLPCPCPGCASTDGDHAPSVPAARTDGGLVSTTPDGDSGKSG